MNCDEVPNWENLLQSYSNSEVGPQTPDGTQVVPELSGNALSGDIQMLNLNCRTTLLDDPDSEEFTGKYRSDSLSSWKSCSSLTSGYMSDETQMAGSPRYAVDEFHPTSPTHTLLDLDLASPNVLETLGPTGL